MASLIKRREKWYARVVWRVNGKKKEIQIPLKTTSLTAARTRLKSVNNEEGDIISGITQKFQFKDIFRWLNLQGTSRFTSLKLGDIIPNYLAYRLNKVRLSTMNRDRISLNQLTEYIGESKAVQDITYKDIESGFIPHRQKQGYADTGINITLRHLRIFFNWLHNKEKVISEPIKFDMIPEGDKLYCYFNESELAALYAYNGVDDFFKRCWFFYEQTGVRPIEPFIGELIGDWLIVDSSKSKGKNVRQVQLNEKLKSILKEMQQFRDSYIKGSSKSQKMRYVASPMGKSAIPPYPPNVRAYERISKSLAKAVKALGFKGKNLTLKSFRHTYGIRRVTQTGDIFQVAREMGHKNVTTTQLYLQFPEQRRLDDFPSLAKHIEKAENKAVLGDGGHDLVDTRAYLRASS
jgi:site-specific recombinase XerD